MSGLDFEMAAGPVGIMQACVDVAFTYVHERKQFDQTIGTFQVSPPAPCLYVTKTFHNRKLVWPDRFCLGSILLGQCIVNVCTCMSAHVCLCACFIMYWYVHMCTCMYSCVQYARIHVHVCVYACYCTPPFCAPMVCVCSIVITTILWSTKINQF